MQESLKKLDENEKLKGYESPKIIIRVTERQNALMRKYAEEIGMSISSVCRLALQDFIDSKHLEGKYEQN